METGDLQAEKGRVDVTGGPQAVQEEGTDLRVLPGKIAGAPQLAADHPAVQNSGESPPKRLLHRSTVAALVLADITAAVVPAVALDANLTWAGLSALLTILLFADSGLYRARLHWSVLDDLPRLLGRQVSAMAVAITCVILLAGMPRLRSVLLAAVLASLSLVVTRAVAYGAIRHTRRRGALGERTIVLGSGDLAEELVGLLVRHPELGLRPVAYVDERRSPRLEAFGLVQHPVVEELETAIIRHDVHTMFVAFGSARDDRLSDVIRRGLAASSDLYVVPRLFEVMNLEGVRDHVGAVPVVRLRRPQRHGLAPASKRTFDVVMSLVSLVLLGPLLLCCALAVRSTGPGVLFRQRRVGRDGQEFQLYKFRSMRPAGDNLTSTTWGTHGDPRMTAVGRVLRRTSLDELPQLVNVLRGDMTLVGPRPERPYFVEQFSRDFQHYAHRHRVRAGLTGMAQVSGLRGENSAIDLRARYDNYYIENWSMWGDIKVIIRTVGEVFRSTDG